MKQETCRPSCPHVQMRCCNNCLGEKWVPHALVVCSLAVTSKYKRNILVGCPIASMSVALFELEQSLSQLTDVKNQCLALIMHELGTRK